MIGRDSSDPPLLQLKEAGRSVLEPYAGPSTYRERGRRVVEGQRLMQTACDALLGWYQLNALDGQRHHYYVRQLWDGKASVDLNTLTTDRLAEYVRLCAWTLARAHAASGDRVAISSYLGPDDGFDTALAAFAVSYADSNEHDHSELAKAIKDRRVQATLGI